MFKNSAVRKTLLALAAVATLFAALPSQAGERWCPPPSQGYGWHDNDRHQRWDGYGDGRWDRGWDARWQRRDHDWHRRYAYEHRREDWRDRHDGRYDHDRDQRWY